MRLLRRTISFARRHRRSAAVSGALIVFLTFIVKDAVREQVKDLVDSLQSAEDVFEIRGQHEVSVGLLNGINQRVELIWQQTPRGQETKQKDDSSGVIHDITDNANIIEQQNATIDNLQRFIARLPDSEAELRTEVAALRDRWEKQDKLYLRVMADINGKKLNEDQEYDAMTTLGPESDGISLAIGDLTDEAVTSADTLRKNAEKRLHVWTWVSYILYTLGWSLALFGRLFEIGVPEPG